ncbi:hypothetical protein QR680_016009 [Steinernema hermaphroditum]|uniref:Uncharacterized protein n=1 Tax=Steinernema hermaphroditum TaxID=289476 RepID=A0AA39HBM3_9BILA|nr:hypothetical protein QR680_016009 [Steinernema hermaphroditum]
MKSLSIVLILFFCIFRIEALYLKSFKFIRRQDGMDRLQEPLNIVPRTAKPGQNRTKLLRDKPYLGYKQRWNLGLFVQ